MVNPDAIAEELPRLEGGLDQRRAGEIAVARRNGLLDQDADFAIETTLTGSSSLRFMKLAKDRGYKLTLVFVGLSDVDLSIRRVLDRVQRGGHPVPISAIERRYPESLAKLSTAAAMADRTYVLDNSDRRRRLLVAREEGRIRFLARQLPSWLMTALPDLAE